MILKVCLTVNHKCETIAKVLEAAIKEWELEHFVTLTVDNVSSNDTDLEYFKNKFKMTIS